MAETYDLLIVNAALMDGTGAPGRPAAVIPLTAALPPRPARRQQRGTVRRSPLGPAESPSIR
jgi:hypothetical protein